MAKVEMIDSFVMMKPRKGKPIRQTDAISTIVYHNYSENDIEKRECDPEIIREYFMTNRTRRKQKCRRIEAITPGSRRRMSMRIRGLFKKAAVMLIGAITLALVSPAAETVYAASVTPVATMAKDITETDAVCWGTVSYSGTRPSEVGIFWGKNEADLHIVATDKINHWKNPMQAWYYLNKEAGVYLEAGETYCYQIYAVQNGTMVRSNTVWFTAAGTKKNPAVIGLPEQKVLMLTTQLFYDNPPRNKAAEGIGYPEVKANTCTDGTVSQYSSDWRYWSQGGSAYYSPYSTLTAPSGMRHAGCHLVSQAKLLRESGVVNDPVDVFNPDILFRFGNADGFYGVKGELNGSVGENSSGGVGAGMIAFARTKGYTITKDSVDVSGKSAQQKVNIIMEKLSAGYYVIIGGIAHHTYVGREESLAEGRPVIWDSGKSSSLNANWQRRPIYSDAVRNGTNININSLGYSVDRIFFYKVEHNHTYNEVGRCSCGQDFPITVTPVKKAGFITKLNSSSKTAPAHTEPYGNAPVTTRYKKNMPVIIVGEAYNAYGNLWYLIKKNDGSKEWIVYDYVKLVN